MDLLGKNCKMIHEEKVIGGQKVDTIRINSELADVHAAAGSGKDIQLLLEGEISESVAEDLTFKVRQSGSTLNIDVNKRKIKLFGLMKSDLHLYVTVPAKVYEDIYVKLGSGDCIVNNIDTKSYSGICSSGKQVIAGLHAQKQLTLQASSGDIFVNNSHSDSVMAEVTSGAVTVSNLSCMHAKYDATSGDIEVQSEKLMGDTECKVTSGDIRVQSSVFSGELDCRATSGNVEIHSKTFPDNLFVDCHLSSGNRKVRVEGLKFTEQQKDRLSGIKGDGSAHSIKAYTTSGNIRILD
ncbi:hypothetical protein GCM10009001_34420 [Virgibacillus siamensis]|uniref:DUF4097 domain-containing protein n=1 Tax=Virgibacillus siamensis TaxID=480071 RepID=A0ABP3RQE0_9BACI